MEALSPEIAAEMRARALANRERQNSAFVKGWSLYGDQAIAKPGGTEIVRLMPRWDFAESLIKVDGKSAPNPAYKARVAYFRAFEHWYKLNGKIGREYCPKFTPLRTGNVNADGTDEFKSQPNFRCVICLAAQALMQGNKEDKKLGKEIAAKEVYLFNAVVGDPRRIDPETKLADIRPLAVPATVYNDISDIMTGGAKPQFARGNIMSPQKGFDIGLNRPAGGMSGERWSVDVVTESTLMYNNDPTDPKNQTVAFKGWPARLTNLEEMVVKDLKIEESIFKAFYGRDPDAGEMDKIFGTAPVAQKTPTAPSAQPRQEQQEPESDAPTSESIEEPDDFLGLMPPAAEAGKRAPRR